MATIAGKNENMLNVHRMSEIDWAETIQIHVTAFYDYDGKL
jgi:hypothetical protein